MGSTIAASVEPAVRKVSSYALRTFAGLKEDFQVEGQEARIIYPENTLKYSAVFRITKSLLHRKKKFAHGKVVNVNVRSLIPLANLPEASIILPEGFEINYDALKSGDVYLLEAEYRIDDPRFVDALVDKIVSRDSPVGEKDTYWMHAQLKFLETFKRLLYTNVAIQDIDFAVDVSVHQDINISIPSYFRRRLNVIHEWIRMSDPRQAWRLSHDYVRLKRMEPSKIDVLEVISNLQNLFLSRNFRRFLDVKKDFRYHDCQRGTDFYEFPFPTWPKTMSVISRVNLSFEKPAADGFLIYKSKDFRKTVENIFQKPG